MLPRRGQNAGRKMSGQRYGARVTCFARTRRHNVLLVFAACESPARSLLNCGRTCAHTAGWATLSRRTLSWRMLIASLNINQRESEQLCTLLGCAVDIEGRTL